MAVAIQDVSSAVVDSASGLTPYTGTANLTVTGSLTNPAMTVTLVFGATVSAVTVHWDSAGANQALTQIGTATETGAPSSCFVFGMVGQPTAGNKTINITWTGTAQELQIFAHTWTGVDQTFANAFPSGHVATVNTNTTFPATLNVTSAVGDAVLAVFNCDITWATPTPCNNTQLYATNGSFVAGCSNRAAGAASVSMTASKTSANDWCGVGIDIVAASGAAAYVPYNPWPQAAPVLAQ